MRTVGLVAEYNPFHLGHAYQIQTIQKQFPDAALVVVMSGNVTQRGEFAVLDKWTRAQLAIMHGADLVVELPLLASLQSADYFAYWAIDLLKRLAVDDLVFGTETADTDQLRAFRDWLKQVQGTVDHRLQRLMDQGWAYPAAMHAAIEEAAGPNGLPFNVSLGNNLLGLKYVQWNEILGAGMRYQALRRQQGFLSGSQVRQALTVGESLEERLPKATLAALRDVPPIQMDAYYPLLQAQVMTKTPADLARIQGMREGLEGLIMKTLPRCSTYGDLTAQLTSKRWTRSAIQRILMAILLNIRQTEWKAYLKDYQYRPFARILAYRSRGQLLLNNYKRFDTIELVSNLTQALYQRYGLTIRTDHLYPLPYRHIPEQNIGRFPQVYSTKAY